MIAGLKSFKLHKLFLAPEFSTDRVGYYLLPLAKQVFRDIIMGSDMEMLPIFRKGYFFICR
jgi:hypothetical protein